MGHLGGSVVKHLTLDLSSGLDLRVVSSSPALGYMLGMEPNLKKKKKASWSINPGGSQYHRTAVVDCNQA